jgi:predicted NAD/FAD-dependent oxidoreductase
MTVTHTDLNVMGAGMAGLIAARLPIGSGLDVVIPEAGLPIGGQLLSLRTRHRGALDHGAAWSWNTDRPAPHLISELGIQPFSSTWPDRPSATQIGSSGDSLTVPWSSRPGYSAAAASP